MGEGRSHLYWLLPLLAAACTARDPGGSSSATNFVVCRQDGDCLRYAGGDRCDDEGYCVDARGERIDTSAAPVARDGSMVSSAQDAAAAADAAQPAGSGGTTATAGSGGIAGAAGSGGTTAGSDRDAGPRADAGQVLLPLTLCACSPTDVKVPLAEFEAQSWQDPLVINFKFEDGSRVRLIDGRFAVDPGGRSEQDRAELQCAALDFAAADAEMESANDLFEGFPEVTLEPTFDGPQSALDAMRDFGGRHCQSQGGEALADLGNHYRAIIRETDGPYLMRALDGNRLVSHVYYGPVATTPDP